jgi:hypothetical protein
MPIKLEDKYSQAFDSAIKAMADFRQVFGRDLEPEFIAELYVARELDLELVDNVNRKGYDALDKSGKRYQIKSRNAQNVDLNNFEFDFLVLVNLDQGYHLIGIWCMDKDKAQTVFTLRDKHNKYQATQNKVKANSKHIK